MIPQRAPHRWYYQKLIWSGLFFWVSLGWSMNCNRSLTSPLFLQSLSESLLVLPPESHRLRVGMLIRNPNLGMILGVGDYLAEHADILDLYSQKIANKGAAAGEVLWAGEFLLENSSSQRGLGKIRLINEVSDFVRELRKQFLIDPQRRSEIVMNDFRLRAIKYLSIVPLTKIENRISNLDEVLMRYIPGIFDSATDFQGDLNAKWGLLSPEKNSWKYQMTSSGIHALNAEIYVVDMLLGHYSQKIDQRVFAALNTPMGHQALSAVFWALNYYENQNFHPALLKETRLSLRKLLRGADLTEAERKVAFAVFALISSRIASDARQVEFIPLESAVSLRK